MFNGRAVVDECCKRFDSDQDMLSGEVFGYNFIAFVGFYAFRNHRLIGNQKQRTCRNMIRKPQVKV